MQVFLFVFYFCFFLNMIVVGYTGCFESTYPKTNAIKKYLSNLEIRDLQINNHCDTGLSMSVKNNLFPTVENTAPIAVTSFCFNVRS